MRTQGCCEPAHLVQPMGVCIFLKEPFVMELGGIRLALICLPGSRFMPGDLINKMSLMRQV